MTIRSVIFWISLCATITGCSGSAEPALIDICKATLPGLEVTGRPASAVEATMNRWFPVGTNRADVEERITKLQVDTPTYLRVQSHPSYLSFSIVRPNADGTTYSEAIEVLFSWSDQDRLQRIVVSHM